MILTLLFLFLAAVGIVAAGKEDPPPDTKAPPKIDLKDANALYQMIFKISNYQEIPPTLLSVC